MSSQKNYFTKLGYKTHAKPVPYNDNEEDSLTYQLDVYRYAAEYLTKGDSQSVLDIGCGYGLKLKEFILPLTDNISGIDENHAISFCKKEYEFGTWMTMNIEDSEPADIGKFDLIISADVVEHLVDPDFLLDLIRNASTSKTHIVISTPERDLRRGKDTMGPPENSAHIREWNKEEFAQYITDRGFEILDHAIMNLKEGMATCQTVLCRII